MTAALDARPDTRTRLIKVTRQLLARSETEPVTMRLVARASGITPGAIYRHFKSRDELIEQVVVDTAARLQADLWQALAKFPVASYERIAELGRIYVDFARKHPSDYAMLFGHGGDPKRKLRTAPFWKSIEALEHCVRDCIEAGVFAPADAKLVALFLWGRLHGLITLYLQFNFSDEFPEFGAAGGLGAIFEATRGFVLDGLRPRSNPARQRKRAHS